MAIEEDFYHHYLVNRHGDPLELDGYIQRLAARVIELADEVERLSGDLEDALCFVPDGALESLREARAKLEKED